MLIKHHITVALPLKGKLHVPDVLGMRLAHLLSPGASLACTFQSPIGEQIEAKGQVAFELINYKGRGENLDKIGGSLIFNPMPTPTTPIGWDLFVLVPDAL